MIMGASDIQSLTYKAHAGSNHHQKGATEDELDTEPDTDTDPALSLMRFTVRPVSRGDSREKITEEDLTVLNDSAKSPVNPGLKAPRPRSPVAEGILSPQHTTLRTHTLRVELLLHEDVDSYVPYMYQPLHHEDSIRLLEVVSGLEGSPLMCKISEVRRTEASYWALSYVWGAPVFTHRIYQRKSRSYVTITANLFSALRALRANPSFHQVIWVDALCIDQSNMSERNHQVKSMAATFLKASRVLAWLGPAECGSVFPTFQKISACRKSIDKARNTKEIPIEKTRVSLVDIITNFEDSKVSNEEKLVNWIRRLRVTIQRCDIVTLGNFFANAWFTRAWVLQEFLLANDFDMYMGKGDTVSFDTIASALDDLKRHENLLPRGPRSHGSYMSPNQAPFVYADDFLQHFEIVHDMFSARKIRRAHSQDPSAITLRRESSDAPPIRTLYQWCRMLVARKCADERDKVYAALGLAYGDSGIVPNYELSVRDVMFDLATRSLDAGDFSILHDAGGPTLAPTRVLQPSFVPSLRSESREYRPRPLGGYDTVRYKAGRSRMSRTKSSRHKRVEIRGVMVDEIFYLDNFADALEDLTLGRGWPSKPRLRAAYDRATSVFSARFNRGEPPDMDFKLAFWRTINLGFTPKRADLPYYEKGVDFQFLDLPYRQKIAECMNHRAFFITKQGFIGVAPDWAQEGDTVVIFDGAETPFLLRQVASGSVDEAWRLIGDCYLEDWMIGDYFGCTVLSGPCTDEPLEAKTYSVGVTYHDTGFKRSTLCTRFFTLC